MKTKILIGCCVKIPDGRMGRVRAKNKGKYKVRVRRKASETHQFLVFAAKDLKPVACPKGWMSRVGYNRYLKKTLAKMKARKKIKF